MDRCQKRKKHNLSDSLSDMSSFKKTIVRTAPRLTSGVSADAIYWRSLKFPVTIQEFGLADCVDFSPDGTCFAVTSSVNVKLYSTISNAVVKRFSRFSKAAFSGRFRPRDGKLLCAGCEDHSVHVIDVNNSSTLRQFRGHTQAVRQCCFSVDGLRVASFSDDRCVALWDLSGESRVCQLEEHEDYVRAGVCSPVSPDQIASGGYDHAVKVWDVRAGRSVMCFQHGAPVESLLYFSSGSLLVSTGGTETRVWDLVSGGRVLTTLSHHTKTVTCAALCCRESRLLTGSIDRRVKVYDAATYQPVHTLDYCSPVVSLALSPDDNKVVVGMSDGLVSVQDRKPPPPHEVSSAADPSQVAALWGRASVPVSKPIKKQTPGSGKLNHGLERHDVLLRQFRHSAALDCVLAGGGARRSPEVAVAVIRELRRRRVLSTALAGRSGLQLRRLCRLVKRHLHRPTLTAPLARLALQLLEVYGGRREEGATLLTELSAVVDTQLSCAEHMQQLYGVLDMLGSAAAVVPKPSNQS